MADVVDSLVGQMGQLTQDQRHEFIAELVCGFEKDVLRACQNFEQCDSCRKIVSSVTEECQGYKDDKECMQRCCDDCVKNCVCGKSYAPSAKYYYEECLHEESDEYVPRCFCGKPIVKPGGGQDVHGDQCVKYARVKLTINGDPTDEQTQVISSTLKKHEMIPQGDDWISSKQYGMIASSIFKSMSEAYPKSPFAALYDPQLHEMRLEFVALQLLFTRKNGTTETTDLDDDTDTFDVPDPSSDEVYESLSLHVVLKIPERMIKKARRSDTV